jgi:S1-C subfamily serine protease
VTEVWPQSAAYRVWLLSWDIIIGIDEIALDREFPLLYELYTKHAGEVIVLHIWRHNKELKMRVPLGMIPAQ